MSEQTTKKHEKLRSMQRVKANSPVGWLLTKLEESYSSANYPVVWQLTFQITHLGTFRSLHCLHMEKAKPLAPLDVKLFAYWVIIPMLFSSPEPSGWANSIPVTQPSVRQHFQTSSPLKPLGQLNSNFIWRLLRTWGWKFVQMVLVSWPRWPPCLYMVRTHLPQNQKADDLGAWYIALGVLGLPSLFKWCS